jgi:hypothetical protein
MIDRVRQFTPPQLLGLDHFAAVGGDDALNTLQDRRQRFLFEVSQHNEHELVRTQGIASFPWACPWSHRFRGQAGTHARSRKVIDIDRL